MQRQTAPLSRRASGQRLAGPCSMSLGSSMRRMATCLVPGASRGLGVNGLHAQLMALKSSAGRRAQRVLASAAATIEETQPATTATSPAQWPPAPGQRVDLPKAFEFSEEERIYKWWERSGYFAPSDSADSQQPPFVMPMPPPNVTGKLHMGHAMFVTLQDAMARHARMNGRPTLWLPGTDHAGIATQSVVEKMLRGEGTNRLELGREAFTERVWQWKEQYGGFITNQMRRLGASCDWSRERFTLDEGLSAAVAEAFVRLHDKGLVYRGSYMVNWSPALRTAVSDLEVEYTEEQGSLYFFKYPIAGRPGEFLPVATTRPETILGDTAVAVNPNDERYKQYIGMECEVPMSGGRRIPIIGDEYVDMEFGTGALKVTPGHDVNDYEIGKRCGLPIINIMNKDATLNAAAGKYAGLDRFEARKTLWADMEAADLVIKKEPYTIRAPRSQRSGEIVEPLVSEQWFVRMAPLAEPALKAVATGEITIMPERFVRTYNNWLENIKDWCISRQLWWGHRIPVWYVFPSAAAADDPQAEGRSADYVVARNEQEALSKAQARFGPDVVLRQEEDVLDTWFSSGLWPFSTLGWPNEASADLNRFYPTQMLETGHDILFFWVARMIMMGIECTGKAPFSHVYLHGLVRDEKGRKMSKSLGNVIDPLDVVSQYGTDALRFTLATGTTVGQDLNLSLDRVTASRNFTNKLWNAGKYCLFQLDKADPSEFSKLCQAGTPAFALSPEALAALPLADRWIVSLLHKTIDEVSERMASWDFNQAGITTYNFFWDQFADWFIEASKTRAGGNDATGATTRAVLVYVFESVLRLLHPLMPYVTEELWQAIPHSGEALITASWPESGRVRDEAALSHFETLQGCVRALRNARAEYGVEPQRKIGAVLVSDDEAVRKALESELPAVCLLAKLDPAAVSIVASAPQQADGAASAGVVTLVVSEGVQVLLPLAGLFDVAKELARLAKQRGKLEKELAGITGKLNNPAFIAKAAAGYVDEARAQEREAREKLALVDAKIAQISALKK